MISASCSAAAALFSSIPILAIVLTISMASPSPSPLRFGGPSFPFTASAIAPASSWCVYVESAASDAPSASNSSPTPPRPSSASYVRPTDAMERLSSISEWLSRVTCTTSSTNCGVCFGLMPISCACRSACARTLASTSSETLPLALANASAENSPTPSSSPPRPPRVGSGDRPPIAGMSSGARAVASSTLDMWSMLVLPPRPTRNFAAGVAVAVAVGVLVSVAVAVAVAVGIPAPAPAPDPLRLACTSALQKPPS
mmetsp:Transcript_87795/g.249897  ORF Transcript_87795/g.249897 Transcript_87795/m.249897 type:complete len:256 (+) Transcript_87795:771-1538(+)